MPFSDKSLFTLHKKCKSIWHPRPQFEGLLCDLLQDSLAAAVWFFIVFPPAFNSTIDLRLDTLDHYDSRPVRLKAKRTCSFFIYASANLPAKKRISYFKIGAAKRILKMKLWQIFASLKLTQSLFVKLVPRMYSRSLARPNSRLVFVVDVYIFVFKVYSIRKLALWCPETIFTKKCLFSSQIRKY